jgi:glycosyltransferase involved in cell wall biosynthesis
MKISVVIPTHNRHQKLKETVEKLRQQDFSANEYEIIVVDDGSTPPLDLSAEFIIPPKVSVVRLEGVERSRARNSGATKARGKLLVFIDDDIGVDRNFLADYWRAHLEFPDALLIGSILLPEDSQKTPFGRFRQNLEMIHIPATRGEVAAKNFCAAGNMAITSTAFQELSGFDSDLTSSEDQDFALRHTARGGKIVFVPEACGIHYDNALDIRGYCQRSEWGSHQMLPFCRRYAGLPANIERERANGLTQWGREPFSQSIRKSIKSVISSNLITAGLFRVTDVFEQVAPNSRALDKLYSLLIGIYIFRGYRAALLDTKMQEKAG